MPTPGSEELDSNMRFTGAQAICESLVRENVEAVFGIPGGGVIYLYHALPEFPIRHVLMRHEQAVIHAADGYARCTGKVGVCFATSGPGATNLLTGLMTALRDSSPVVALTGQSASYVIGTEAFQEVDITGITLPASKHNYLVTDTLDLPSVMKEAFHIARTGRPGPVVVTVATDVQSAAMDYAYPASADLPGYRASEGGIHQPDPGEEGCPRPDQEKQTLQGAAKRGEHPSVGTFVAREVRRVTQGDGLLVSDLVRGQGGGPAGSTHGAVQDQTQPAGPGTPGSALPAAIGKQLGQPGRQVWVVEEAQSFEMSIQELATVAQESLPIRMVILGSGSIAQGVQQRPDQKAGPKLGSGPLLPDLARVAGAYGIQGLTVYDAKDLAPLLAQAAAVKGPVLLDARIVQDLPGEIGRGTWASLAKSDLAL